MTAGKVDPSTVPAGASEGGAQFTVEDAQRYIATVRWQFAKTMPLWPHEYTVRTWRPELERDFCAFALLIAQQGVVKPWPRDAAVPRYRHPYLDIDGWQYWTMGAPAAETEVINRARLDGEEYRPDPAQDRVQA